jgi:hypothetical protein
MLSSVPSYPRWLAQKRSTPASPFLDDLVAALTKAGNYSNDADVVRGAAISACGCTSRAFLDRTRRQLDPRFKQHFDRADALGSVADVGAIARSAPPTRQQPRLVSDFCQWMQQHRGAKGR